MCVHGGRGEGAQKPSLPLPSFQKKPIQPWVIWKNQATQQPGPVLTREGPTQLLAKAVVCSPQLTPSLRGERVFACVCMHRHTPWVLHPSH